MMNLRGQVVRMGDGLNWLRIMSSGRLWYKLCWTMVLITYIPLKQLYLCIQEMILWTRNSSHGVVILFISFDVTPIHF